jgi:preprotein translocase subunit SecA
MFHSRALKQFPKSHFKSLDELLEELTDLNETLKLDLRKEFMKIVESRKDTEKFEESHIKKWAQEIKEDKSNPSKYERISVVLRGFELFKHKIRDVQVLALILLYQKSNGTLAQINTGEGKTAIVAMLACLYALEGKKVDIGEFETS